SAVAPAKPATTSPALPSRRTLRALPFMTVLPRVTWPSLPITTRPSRRTQTMVVAWKDSMMGSADVWAGAANVGPRGWRFNANYAGHHRTAPPYIPGDGAVA